MNASVALAIYMLTRVELAYSIETLSNLSAKRSSAMDDSVPQHVQILLTSISRENGISKPRVELSTCSGTGDNYIGKVYRVLIRDEASSSQLHLVLKTPPASKQRREYLRVGTFFKNEAHVYQNILPALAQCYERGSHDTDEPFLNAPRFYGSALSNDENDVIILEDMKKNGFVMADRRVGLDENHCRLVLTELARLHAASFALQTTNPELHNSLSSRLTENVFVAPRENEAELLPSLCENIRNLIKNRFPEGTLERTKFEHFGENFGSVMRDFVLKVPKLAVITHGDTWINNLLFKYNKESGLPEKISLIDYQVSRYASPVLDLSYFLFTSTTKLLRDKHYEELIGGYHSDLSIFLDKMGFNAGEIVPWSLFREELKGYGAYGWGMAMMVVPLFLADKKDLVGVDEDISVVNSPKDMFFKSATDKNTQLEERMSDILEDVVRFGYL